VPPPSGAPGPLAPVITAALDEHLRLLAELRARGTAAIEAAAGLLVQALRGGGKVLLFGNGGSAADAQHIAAELVGRFRMERGGLAAVALTTDTSALTAIANDYGYERVFARQVEALACPGDAVVALSTSGNSANVVEAVALAARLGCATIGLTGGDGGRLGAMVQAHLNVPHKDTARVQEAHITLGHILCDCVERTLGAG
jgi:D-sedoheptulose 7-phosphate isomerase